MTPRGRVLRVRLDKRVAACLDRLARRKGLTRSAAVRDAIERAVVDFEREDALKVLITHAEQDQQRLRGRKPPVSKFALR